MLDYFALRQTFRIPWIRDNRKAIHYLSDVFYLLLALFRAGRMRDFLWLQGVYFRMLHAFAQYGRREAKATVREFLAVPWFAERRRDLYRLILAYNRVIRLLPPVEGVPPGPDRALRLRAAVRDYVDAMKSLVGFDEKDEARVRRLLRDPTRLDRCLESFASVAS